MKIMYKKLFAFVLSIVMLFTIFGCDSNKNDVGTVDSRNVFVGESSEAWMYEKGKGTFDFSVPADSKGLESAPRLLKDQLSGEWIIHTQINHNSADQGSDTHMGIMIYVDDNNYLIWGQRNNEKLELSGVLGGKETGALAECDTLYEHLRIWKITRDGEATRYYVYGAEDAYYKWQYVGYFEDENTALEGAQYGLGAWDNEPNGTGYCVSYDFCDDYVIYNYKDTFESAKLDGRWVETQTTDGDIANKGGKTILSAGSEPVLMLRNTLPYDWTVECQTVYSETGSDCSDMVVWKDKNNYLAIGGNYSKVTARVVIDGKELVIGEHLDKTVRFLKIVQNNSEYSLRYSDSGTQWEELAVWNDESGLFTNEKYGLMAEPYNTATFDWFNERATPNGIIEDIAYTEKIAKITGEDSINQTESNWGWGSGDLGSMFYFNDAVYMCFGDTYQYANQRGNWYRNSMAKIVDLDSFKTGLKFDWMRKTSATCDHGLVGGRSGSDDQSIIATSGIGINQNGVDTLYIHLMYIRKWVSYGTHWEINGSTWAYSTDDGASWTAQDCMFEGDTNFAQIACHQVGDDVYIWGAGTTGTSSVKLAKVPAAEILNIEAYRYFAGTDASGEPIWVENEHDGVAVIDSLNREFCVAYDEELDCYLMTTLDNVNQQMVLRDSKTPWGEWSKPILLFDESYVEHEDPTDRHFYGCYMNSAFMDDGGKTVYMTLNKWVPYNISWMKVQLEVKGGYE